jgi:hypothetical protein
MRALALAGAFIVALGAATSAQALAAAAVKPAGTSTISTPAAKPTHTSTTPIFPVPASAKGQPGTDTGTTTYVPSSGKTPRPSTVPSVATTTPTVSTPTVALGRTPLPLGARTPSRHAARRRSLSTSAIVIAVIAALVALGCAAWGLARRRAFEPHWWLSLRHAMAEAGFRASATWAEFADWARLGH